MFHTIFSPTCFPKTVRHCHSSPISGSSTDVRPRFWGAPLHDQFFVHAVMHKNLSDVSSSYVLMIPIRLKYCTAKISCKYQIVFFIHSVLPKCIFTHYWGLTHKNADLWGTCTMSTNTDQLPLGVVKLFPWSLSLWKLKCIISLFWWFSGIVLIYTCHHLSPAKFGNRTHNGKMFDCPQHDFMMDSLPLQFDRIYFYGSFTSWQLASPRNWVASRTSHLVNIHCWQGEIWSWFIVRWN
jgi:hypothetical protein